MTTLNDLSKSQILELLADANNLLSVQGAAINFLLGEIHTQPKAERGTMVIPVRVFSSEGADLQSAILKYEHKEAINDEDPTALFDFLKRSYQPSNFLA